MKEKIIQFKKVKVNIPQKLLIKHFYSCRVLTFKESQKIGQKLKQIEIAIEQLEHARSIVGRILLREV